LLEVFLSIVELWGKVAFLTSVVFFGLSSVFVFLALLLSVIGGLVTDFPASMGWAVQQSALFGMLGAIGALPFLGYLGMLFCYAITQTVRAWVATEDNTRKSAEK
jgi:hypothetical protein